MKNFPYYFQNLLKSKKIFIILHSLLYFVKNTFFLAIKKSFVKKHHEFNFHICMLVHFLVNL